MVRFLLGVLFAFGLWWGYERFVESPADAAGQSLDATAFLGAGGTPEGAEAAVPGVAAPVDPRASVTAPVPEPAAAVGFAAAEAMTGASRDAAIAASVREARAAADVGGAIAALGADNAFLRLREGRELAAEIVGRIEQLPAWEAARASTQLMETAMRGPIGRDRPQAIAAFDELARRHGRLVQATVFNPGDLTGARSYEVQSGDVLVRIAKRLREKLGVRVESGTLQVVNGIDPRRLREGQILKCPVDPIRTVVHKESFIVAVYVGDILVRTYWCAHGKQDSPGHRTETPEAVFTVGEKIEGPDWHYGGRVVPFGHPDNPLGTRFVRFENPAYSGLGIHGTSEPESIGTMASLGCVRLDQPSIEDYFLLVPRGTEVQVVR
jgi:lipoprotein-anchoring transpeptidase ErfK/SrfK